MFHTDSQKFSHGLFVGLVAPSSSFDLVADVVKDGVVDVEDAGAERCVRWFLGGPMADGQWPGIDRREATQVPLGTNGRSGPEQCGNCERAPQTEETARLPMLRQGFSRALLICECSRSPPTARTRRPESFGGPTSRDVSHDLFVMGDSLPRIYLLSRAQRRAG